MNYQEILEKSRPLVGDVCKSCPVCNGKACGNRIPGPGAKGSGLGAIRNYEAWQEIFLNMDTIVENKEVDTSFEVFGKTFKYPIFAGPVGAVNNHYGKMYDDVAYNSILIKACAENGILGFTGDGVNYSLLTCLKRELLASTTTARLYIMYSQVLHSVHKRLGSASS